jgi:glycosyltransferase involved in cell wall biosynthesis
MNILLINYEFPPIGGGGGTFSKDLAAELAKTHDVDVLTSHYQGLKKTETSDGVHIHRVPVIGRTSPYHATVLSMLSFIFSGTAKGIMLASGKKYDIINTHFAVPTGPVGLALSRIFGIPNVLSVHGSDVYNPSSKLSPHHYPLLRWAVRIIMNGADKVVAQSRDNKNCAERFYHPKTDISVIPLGMPEPSCKITAKEGPAVKKNGFRLISIGRMAKVKGYEHLIKAMDLLRKRGQDLMLLLVGDGPERAVLEELSRELSVADIVEFPGWISGEQKYRLLSESDLYVMSSIHEGFGVVLLEAMACGLPIVCTNRGGQTDIIEDNKNGILVPPSDAEALADAILALKNDAERRRAMSFNNKEHVKQYFIADIAQRYDGLFRDVLARKGNI